MQPIVIFEAATQVYSQLTNISRYVTMNAIMDTSSPMMQEVEEVKKELAGLIVAHLKDKRLSLEVAQKQAAAFLDLLPIEDQKDLLLKLKNLAGQYEEARQIYIKKVGTVEESKRHIVLTQLHDLIKESNIDQALMVAKDYTQKQGEYL